MPQRNLVPVLSVFKRRLNLLSSYTFKESVVHDVSSPKATRACSRKLKCHSGASVNKRNRTIAHGD